jgi:hypothetical protein
VSQKTSKYNDPKRLYIIYRKDTHEYLQEISTNWGYFCTARLFHDKTLPLDLLKIGLKELYDNKVAQVLEIDITKWQAKEPLPI